MRERVTAADGKTDLYAVYFAPRGRSAGIKNPVIDAVYGGPQVIVTPRNFIEAYRGGERGKSSLAQPRIRGHDRRRSWHADALSRIPRCRLP